MANTADTGYKSNQLLFFKEITEGQVPATIDTAYALSPLSMNFDRIQRTETNTLLANGGQPSKTDTGGEDPAGSFELKCTPDWDVLLTQAVIGEYTTKTVNTDVRADSTAYIVDDIVILGTDVLVCITAGTSDVDAVAITALATPAKTGALLIDGTVKWVITKNKTAVNDYVGVLNNKVNTWGLLFTDTTVQGGGLSHNTLGRGVSINNMSIGKESGVVVAKTSHNVIAHGALSDTQDGYTAPTITEQVLLQDNAYKRDEVCVLIDGVAPSQVESIMLNIERAITVTDAVACIEVAGVKTSEKITTIGTPVISGNLVARFSTERFAQAFNNEEQELVIEYRKPTGEFSRYTIPRTQLLDATKAYDTSKPITIDIPLNAYGDISQEGISYEVRSFLDYTK